MDRYIVDLSKQEREDLLILVKKGKCSAKKIRNAQILLYSDINQKPGNKTNEKIGELLHISSMTVCRIKKRFVEEGLESALSRKPHSRTRPKKIDGKAEAHLVRLCCSNPPEGRSSWTLELLSDELVRLKIVESVSATTIGRTLKKTNLSLGEK